MTVPIFKTCFADAAVKNLLGSNPMRLYEFDEAPQGVTPPYAVWQQVSGNPENYLAGRPDMDDYRIQIDVYGASRSSAKAVKQAIEQAVELKAHTVGYNGEFREKDTRLYRISFDVSWFVSR